MTEGEKNDSSRNNNRTEKSELEKNYEEALNLLKDKKLVLYQLTKFEFTQKYKMILSQYPYRLTNESLVQYKMSMK